MDGRFALGAALIASACHEVCSCPATDSGAEDVAAGDALELDAAEPDAPADTGLDDGPADPGVEPPPGGYEARGVWVTRWNFSSAGDITTIMDEVASGGFNQVYFQVRGTADAFYVSTLEPWSATLGALGVDPGWDPLDVAVTEAHARGLEIHAWINTFPVWSGTTPPPMTTPEHVYSAHPDWICADSGGTPMPLGSDYVFGSPGNPDFQDHIAAVAAEIVSSYSVDGLHLDYVRYPGPDYCHDATSESRFAAALASDPSLVWDDWQRDQVSAAVGKVYAAVKGARPDAVLSTAVWGIYRNTWGWTAVSQGYSDYFQDPRAWAAAGTVDAVVPMIYWDIKDPYGTRLDFRALLDDHVANMSGRSVYAGIHGDYDDFAEIAAEIAYGRESGARGYVVFAYVYLVSHAYLDDFASGPNALEAWPPP